MVAPFHFLGGGNYFFGGLMDLDIQLINIVDYIYAIIPELSPFLAMYLGFSFSFFIFRILKGYFNDF